MSTWVVVTVVVIMIGLVLWGTLSMVYVVQEYERGVLFRLGRVRRKPKGPGLIILLPFGIDRMRKVTLQTVAINVPPQNIITKDNLSLRVDMVVYCRVVDPVAAVVRMMNYLYALSQAAQTTLRATLGKYELDTLLAEPERINRELQGILARVAYDWGVDVLGADIKSVDLPGGTQIDYAALQGQPPVKADVEFDESMNNADTSESLIDSATGEHEANGAEEAVQQRQQSSQPRIFLCYRREDTLGFARGVYESLSAKYGEKQVFRDVDSTPLGIRYTTWIRSMIGQCDVMIVLIGNAWTSAKDQTGRRRLDLPKDLVREEIEEGLRREIPIIPVCVQGTRMPSEADLPPSIAGLAGFQSTEITDSRWSFDIARLLHAIDDLIDSGDNF